MNESNKKGFTLIEMITVIVILSLLVLIIVPLVSTNLKKGNEKAYQAQINNIIASAKNWGINNKNLLPQDGNIISLTLKYLQDEGYIDKNLKDPRTGDTLNGCIDIQNKNGKQHYTFNDKCDVVYAVYNIAGANIGSSIEEKGTTTNYLALGKNRFFKHMIKNGKIESSELCFLKDGDMHCLKPNEYETSKTKLLEIFGESACNYDDPDYSEPTVVCNDSSMRVSAFSSGLVNVYDYSSDCSVSPSGNSNCG